MTTLRKAWSFVVATVAIVALVVIALLGRGGSIGGRLAAYLKRRESAEAKARAAADAELAKINGDVAKANEEIRHDADSPARTINGSGR